MNNEATSNSKDWDATSLRFTGFLAPDAKIQESDWWKAVVGESPDTRHIQEKKGSVKNVGRFEEGNLTLKMEPFRVDWFYEAIKSPEEPDMSGVLGSFNNAIPVFVDAMQKWFLSENLPSLQRIAFGAIVLKPVKTREAGYERLSKYLESVKIDPEGSSDFLYRINRPRDSSTDIGDLRINRLMTWGVITARFLGFDFQHQKNMYAGQETFAARLELDISTFADPSRQFNVSEYKTIFDELVQLAIEISQKGDIK